MAYGEHLNWWQGPPLLRKRVRNVVVFTILLGIAAVVFVMLRTPLGIPYEPWGRYGALIFGVTPIVIIWPLFLLSRVRLKRSFIEAKGRLCTHCGYNLFTLPERGTCPECGQAFNAATDAAKWTAAGFA